MFGALNLSKSASLTQAAEKPPEPYFVLERFQNYFLKCLKNYLKMHGDTGILLVFPLLPLHSDEIGATEYERVGFYLENT